MTDPASATRPVSPLQAIIGVRELLDALGDALVSWRLDTVEAIHDQLADAVVALASTPPPTGDLPTRQQLVTELGLAANAVGRCRRLGLSISELTRLHAHALGETESYNAAGAKMASGAVPLLRARG